MAPDGSIYVAGGLQVVQHRAAADGTVALGATTTSGTPFTVGGLDAALIRVTL